MVYLSASHHSVEEQLLKSLGEFSGLLFFLMSAMTIVELIDAHHGFDLITKKINRTDKRYLLWTLSLITFFLSAILDNLTTSIVIVMLIRKLMNKPQERMFFIGIMIIAANAGGVWSPMGDITSTMLWIGKQVTPKGLITLFLPSLASLIIPLIICSFKLKGNAVPSSARDDVKFIFSKRIQYIVLISGLVILISVPVLKMFTGLPPYMIILFGLGILWIITEIIHHNKKDESYQPTVADALRRIDTPSILFFLGILLAVAALQSAGILQNLATWLDDHTRNKNMIAAFFGLLSSIVDNVPLVAASQAMYSYPTDHDFWLFLTYCTGTGGSILLIGSAAGVAAMGIEKISFTWYLRKVSPVALIGFITGIVVYFIQNYFLHM
jgi:Na+/H+ antiporter NhaD/arsenite permease-like protein